MTIRHCLASLAWQVHLHASNSILFESYSPSIILFPSFPFFLFFLLPSSACLWKSPEKKNNKINERRKKTKRSGYTNNERSEWLTEGLSEGRACPEIRTINGVSMKFGLLDLSKVDNLRIYKFWLEKGIQGKL